MSECVCEFQYLKLCVLGIAYLVINAAISLERSLRASVLHC